MTNYDSNGNSIYDRKVIRIYTVNPLIVPLVAVPNLELGENRLIL